MDRKIILSADSVCDIGEELREACKVQYFYFHIQLGNQSYVDMVDISPEEIYEKWRIEKILPKTAAITPEEYSEFFQKWVEEGYEVVHINLGSALSSAHQNCCIAAKSLGNVYPIDSGNLSSGIGHLVLKARELIDTGMSAKEVAAKVAELRGKVHASFVLNTLEFMKAGGRCGAVAAFGANLLNLKPCIEVDNEQGAAMRVGKKYRGDMEKVLVKYITDKLKERTNIDTDRVFITHSGSPESDIALAKAEVLKYIPFKKVYVTHAGGTISSHCGPRTLGVLFMTK
jgi:DegV family protein with EDD domain